MRPRNARAGRSERRSGSGLPALPGWAWDIAYYVALLFLYRYLIYPYIHDVLERQMLGLGDTAALTFTLAGYLLLCALPPYFWSRKSYYHPVWRGVESFITYAAVALIMGAVFAAADEGSWNALSGVSASGAAWARIGSALLLLAAFMAAAWQGGKNAEGRRRKQKSKGRRKGSATSSS